MENSFQDNASKTFIAKDEEACHNGARKQNSSSDQSSDQKLPLEPHKEQSSLLTAADTCRVEPEHSSEHPREEPEFTSRAASESLATGCNQGDRCSSAEQPAQVTDVGSTAPDADKTETSKTNGNSEKTADCDLQAMGSGMGNNIKPMPSKQDNLDTSAGKTSVQDNTREEKAVRTEMKKDTKSSSEAEAVSITNLEEAGVSPGSASSSASSVTADESESCATAGTTHTPVSAEAAVDEVRRASDVNNFDTETVKRCIENTQEKVAENKDDSANSTCRANSDDNCSSSSKSPETETRGPVRTSGVDSERELSQSAVGRSPSPERQWPSRSRWASNDLDQYQRHYPGKKDFGGKKNLQFYLNEIKSRPDGVYIEEILINWEGEHTRLERNHGYIQWLFPIREPGMNYQAQELQLGEIESMKVSEEVRHRLIRSYRLMLDFYGLRLVDEESGEVENSDLFDFRMQHLNSSSHNWLRITRILKCLGELGLEHYKPPLVEKLVRESHSDRGRLRAAETSCRNYWVGTLRDEQKREQMYQLCLDLLREVEQKSKAENRSNAWCCST